MHVCKCWWDKQSNSFPSFTHVSGLLFMSRTLLTDSRPTVVYSVSHSSRHISRLVITGNWLSPIRYIVITARWQTTPSNVLSVLSVHRYLQLPVNASHSMHCKHHGMEIIHRIITECIPVTFVGCLRQDKTKVYYNCASQEAGLVKYSYGNTKTNDIK